MASAASLQRETTELCKAVEKILQKTAIEYYTTDSEKQNIIAKYQNTSTVYSLILVDLTNHAHNNDCISQ